MWRHACGKHGEDMSSFVMNVTGNFRDDAMLRQNAKSARHKMREGRNLFKIAF
jgi:hypothetical protein